MLRERKTEGIADAITRSMLRLTVNPTEQCNLRCSYCYETFVLRKMPVAVCRGVINLIRRRASLGLELLELEFFGGEPLTAWDVVSHISREASSACKNYKTAFVGGMTTNGTLLSKERLELLVQYGISRFQITLDGPPEVHDTRRATSRGQGSFGAIWANLLMLKASKYNFLVTVRIHHDPTTVDTLISSGFVQRVIEYLVIGDDRFSMHFHAICKLGGTGDDMLSVYDSALASAAATERTRAGNDNVGGSPYASASAKPLGLNW